MSARSSRIERVTGRTLAMVVALLLATTGVMQTVHGAAAERARAVVASCEGGHATPGLHRGAPSPDHHDEARCAQCQAFAQARTFQTPPAAVPTAAAGTRLLGLAPETVSCGDPATHAHPPRAPPASPSFPA